MFVVMRMENAGQFETVRHFWYNIHDILVNRKRFTYWTRKGDRAMFDCVIVGAGFAGSVMAERLAAEQGKRYFLLNGAGISVVGTAMTAGGTPHALS